MPLLPFVILYPPISNRQMCYGYPLLGTASYTRDHDTSLHAPVSQAGAIVLRTPVTDDKGKPHVLEHCLLGGSRKYPAKAPPTFDRLNEQSLATFLNAETYADRTLFPVSSTNLKDFYNLVSGHCLQGGWLLVSTQRSSASSASRLLPLAVLHVVTALLFSFGRIIASCLPSWSLLLLAPPPSKLCATILSFTLPLCPSPSVYVVPFP